KYWAARAASLVDDAASLAWYHRYCIAPGPALEEWNRLAEAARSSTPPRMREHFDLQQWWEPVGLLDEPPSSPEGARAFRLLGVELYLASLGNRSSSLRQAIACYEAALRVYTEEDFPQGWASTQNNLGN